jgi:hypothetical protein
MIQQILLYWFLPEVVYVRAIDSSVRYPTHVKWEDGSQLFAIPFAPAYEPV